MTHGDYSVRFSEKARKPRQSLQRVAAPAVLSEMTLALGYRRGRWSYDGEEMQKQAKGTELCLGRRGC